MTVRALYMYVCVCRLNESGSEVLSILIIGEQAV